MMVTKASRCDVAVLFGHHTFRVYQIARDQEFIDSLFDRLLRFREDNWLAGVPPLPTGHPVDTEIVKSEYGDPDDFIKPATPEQTALVRELQQARVNVGQAELRKEELQNLLRQIIGDATGISGPFGVITYKRTKDSTKTEWEMVAQSYRQALTVLTDKIAAHGPPPTDVFVTMPSQGDLDAIQSLYTRTVPGYPRFNYQFKEEQDA
jgi:hypothetical protein